MTPPGARTRAPRWLRRIGARLLFLAGLGLGLGPAAAEAQVPRDTVQVGDSLAVADSASMLDSIAQLAADSDSISPDTIFYNLPLAHGGAPASFATGIWEWDRDGIMVSGANNLLELFQDVPGLIPLLGGDYGTPVAMSAFGHGGGGYRIVRDGVELYPFDGSVIDLQRVGLVGITRVRLDRSLGQMVVRLWSHEYDDGRPFAVIEAGTGALATNTFRGFYADPTALGGSASVGLERADTRGRRGEVEEGGSRTGSWARYQLHLRDRLGVGIEYHRGASQTKVTDYSAEATRADLLAQAGLTIVEGVTLGAHAGRSRFETVPRADDYHRVGGERRQYGARLGVDRGSVWLDGSYERYQGSLPKDQIDAEGGLSSERWGGFSGRYLRGSWNDATASSYGARVWLSPLRALTLFGAYEDGKYGSRADAVREGPGPPPIVEPSGPLAGLETLTDRTTSRAGVLLSHWGVTLGGAALKVRSDRMLPLGTELDAGSPTAAGFDRMGYEGSAVLPTLWQGLTVEGSYQRWDQEGPYLPKEIYRGSFEYHRIFKESGNLEVWGSFGVRGHDPMLTFVADDGSGEGGVVRVPFYQDWYLTVQVRVVTVRLWLGWDNLTLRRNLKLYPGRLLPYGRSIVALRWDLWN